MKINKFKTKSNCNFAYFYCHNCTYDGNHLITKNKHMVLHNERLFYVFILPLICITLIYILLYAFHISQCVYYYVFSAEFSTFLSFICCYSLRKK